uniref:MADF domain-containing protein n=1 Tax=Stomoxys calcitrans TaxID=35570 RepID=A0A1I8Q7C5_STOCA
MRKSKAIAKAKKRCSDEERQRLIKVLKKYPIIWDLNHKDKNSRKLTNMAWEKVAREVNVNEHICRVTWRSIRDSRRYYRNKAVRQGSGSLLEGDCSLDGLEFLNESSVKRIYANGNGEETTREEYVSPYLVYDCNNPDSKALCDEIEEIVPENSEDEYEETDRRPHTTNHSETMETNAKSIKYRDSIESQCNEESESRSNSISANNLSSQGPNEELNDTFLRHLNAILKKLPLKTAENLEARFMAMTYEELAKHRDS